MSQRIPEEQRALVMQGGGALGAYEAGVFKALYERFIKPSNQSFDIVAGVSIGAVNASILVNYVTKNNNKWDGSAETLYNFWDDISTSPSLSNPISWPLYLVDNNPFLASGLAFQEFFRTALAGYYRFFTGSIKTIWKLEWPYIPIWRGEEWPPVRWISWQQNWKEELPYILYYFLWPDNYGPVALHEAARRYYSWRYFMLTGAPNVYTSFIPQLDLKFFDLFNPHSVLYRVSNDSLIRSIKKYWHPNAPPLRTNIDANQPRLLLVSVDLQNCASATFDSYEKGKDEYGDAVCRTVYGEDKTKYRIEYPEGIGMEHLMTSMAFHSRHKYPTLEVKQESNAHSKPRPFWDAIYLSNTPLRELLQAHRDYWHGVRGLSERIPKLKVYMVDLYPTVEKGIPEGFDEINDRQYDVLFHDKTRYDEKVAHLVTDYINMGKRMRELLDDAINTVEDQNRKETLTKRFEDILNTEGKSRTRDHGKKREYKELLEGHFEVEVFRIERSEDHETDIYGKAFDFSRRTIDQLRIEGYKDANNSKDIEW
ncbi:MAG TPA: patatin-like phospholipase family protein [Nitrososphaeraceae archaeon]|nr:patatin-like phospholipase family protein [Nitrososphaeraceae archaeon]